MPKYYVRYQNYTVTVKYVHTNIHTQGYTNFTNFSKRLGATSKFQESEG